MRPAILFAVLAALPSLAAGAEPPVGKRPAVVRPASWWSDLNRVSDGGGPALPPTTVCVTGPKAFAKEWARLGIAGVPPKVDFAEYVVVVAFRVSGLEFDAGGGLEVDAKGNAKVVGPPAILLHFNAGSYSTTVGVFPRRGVATLDGHKLPAAEPVVAAPAAGLGR